MANIIKIKRSAITATPTTLAEGELAYSENSGNLFIGTNGGVDLKKIGGNTDVVKLATIAASADKTSTNETSHTNVLIDGDFGTAGLMKTDGAGTYSIVTDNNTNWNTAYTHSTLTTGNPHSVTQTEVGLSNVVNSDTTNADNISDGSTNAIITLVQESKLDAIESLADVTDSLNVSAAGAVMFTSTNASLMSFVIDENDFISDSNTKVPTQQSVKSYIDASVVGATHFIGGYDASTNTPDLDVTVPTNTLPGDMYTVTVSGVFFSTNVYVGDFLFANTTSASTIDDWSIVENPQVLTAIQVKTVYESNENTNVFTDAEKTQVGLTSGTNTGDNSANTLYSGLVSNVSTTLDHGTITATTYGITSDGGANDIILPEATTSTAGLLGASKWNEIVANNAKLTNVPTNLSVGTIGVSAISLTTDGGIDQATIPAATTSTAGLLTADLWNHIDSLSTVTTSDLSVTLSTHGLENDDRVSFATIVTTTGIIIRTIYYIVNKTDDTFQVALTLGGSPIVLTTDGSGTLMYINKVVSQVPGVSITMDRPATSSIYSNKYFGLANKGVALMKGFTVTG